jgi:Arc/MetJ-type ribon-helix-helix transcriptional regulator
MRYWSFIETLHWLARSPSSTSDLIREGIDRVIQDRLNKPSDRAQLRAGFNAFLVKHAGKYQGPPDEDIEELVSRIKRQAQQSKDRPCLKAFS